MIGQVFLLIESPWLKVFLGVPSLSHDWSTVLLKLVLATTEIYNPEPEDFQCRQTELSEVVRRGPAALIAASSRFQILERQYKTITVAEDLPTPGVGVIVRLIVFTSPA